ncbi:hypothetical protein I3843_01G144000 [Carya illinoinensis]|uniref:Uncharacterized protein n=1 Tax=Carya illinoinensis TaxID=32201 RepID=A0A8T1RN14_CARIL|nr:hypothetical protein I3760_01G148600 [Carya illinoinensis]KAG6668176.1 hypothetical protein CIPAW_01G152800 [Carya illinoinensis]KAG6731907.1 hypothetical protein I3842_01G151600 [Carya illinoinensis]KAG7996130.1 hypothetical protein I3843_01G144000 [Carya illinoinensis]
MGKSCCMESDEGLDFSGFLVVIVLVLLLMVVCSSPPRRRPAVVAVYRPCW